MFRPDPNVLIYRFGSDLFRIGIRIQLEHPDPTRAPDPTTRAPDPIEHTHQTIAPGSNYSSWIQLEHPDPTIAPGSN